MFIVKKIKNFLYFYLIVSIILSSVSLLFLLRFLIPFRKILLVTIIVGLINFIIIIASILYFFISFYAIFYFLKNKEKLILYLIPLIVVFSSIYDAFSVYNIYKISMGYKVGTLPSGVSILISDALTNIIILFVAGYSLFNFRKDYIKPKSKKYR